MQIGRKGPAYRASKEDERKLRLYGVPGRYWNFRDRHVRGLTTFTTDRPWAKNDRQLSISLARQQDSLKEIFEDNVLATTSPVVAVGCEPTDELGLIFAGAVVARATQLKRPDGTKLRPLMVNVGINPFTVKEGTDPDVLILWNIKGDSPPSRVDMCRDWLAKFDDTFRIVIVAGSTPAHFFYNRLNWQPDTSLYFRGEFGA